MLSFVAEAYGPRQGYVKLATEPVISIKCPLFIVIEMLNLPGLLHSNVISKGCMSVK